MRTKPTKFLWRSSGAGFLLHNREILVDGQDILNDGFHCLDEHTSAVVHQRVTVSHKRVPPGARRTQSVAGGHRALVVHTVRRIPLVAPLPASPALPSRVQLSSAEMGVLAAQQDEVVVILHPVRLLHVEHQDLALSARLPSQRPRRT